MMTSILTTRSSRFISFCLVLILGFLFSSPSYATLTVKKVNIFLTLTYQPNPGSTSSFTVGCIGGIIKGTHPNRVAICKKLIQSGTKIFAPSPAQTMCSQIYGGDQKARVVGAVNGRKVAATFNRVDGCQVIRWNGASVLFTFPGFSQLSGQIDVSPTCPGPQQAGQICTKESVAGQMKFTSAAGTNLVAKSIEGKGFAILLKNGNWSATGKSASAMHCETRSITVPTSANFILACDTGIR
jgi:hypothetical protein